MPFPLTVPASKPEPAAAGGQGEPDTKPETRTDKLGDTWRQEKQVRLTAQHFLLKHLRDERAKGQHPAGPPSSCFWPDIRLDLSGATLIKFSLEDSVTASADFSEATFSDTARFSRATFSGTAGFRGATFKGIALFSKATFSGTAMFEQAIFRGITTFGRAIFRGIASFSEATFSGTAMFNEATFSGGADSLNFEQSRVLSPDAKHSWPTGWRLEPDGSGGYTVAHANDDGRS